MEKVSIKIGLMSYGIYRIINKTFNLVNVSSTDNIEGDIINAFRKRIIYSKGDLLIDMSQITLIDFIEISIGEKNESS